MLKAYKYCLLPTEEQKQTLSQWFGSVRFVYNLGLEAKIAAWTSLRKNVTSFDLMKQLTELKRTECKWLADCSGQSLESSLTNLDNAYTQFFKGGGFPKFKKRSNRQSIQFRRDTKIKEGKVFLTKIGGIDFIQHRPLGKGEIRTTTVSKTPANNYFVSILIETGKDVPTRKAIKEKTTVGIDVGIKTFATLSDGQQFENPKYLQHQLNRLRVEQRKLKRRLKKGAKEQPNGYQKQKLVVAKLHEKISNQRNDFLQKTSTAIIKQHDTVCLENLNVKGMMQNRKLSKAISDVGWYSFAKMLEYKADWYGKNIIYIGRFAPSSKTCSVCGNIFKELKLSDRMWICEKCGTEHDRDINAAKNIKNFGFKAEPSVVNVGH